jgi:hypothetical protein
VILALALLAVIGQAVPLFALSRYRRNGLTARGPGGDPTAGATASRPARFTHVAFALALSAAVV